MKKYLLILLLASCATKENIQISEPVKREIVAAKKEEVNLNKKVKFQEIIYFPFDSSSITRKAASKLTDNIIWLKQNPTKNIIVQGHCDERGTKEYNLALGARRAHAVKRFLINSNIEKNRIEAVSYGEERPNSLGFSERAHAKNRRAQFLIN